MGAKSQARPAAQVTAAPLKRARNAQNPAFGRAFEAVLSMHAERLGLWLITHGSRVRTLRGGKHVLVQSDLDFRLYSRTGQHVVFDAKSYQGSGFVYSALTAHQTQRARMYAEHGVQSGFVVELRALNTVVWFSIACIDAYGPRTRFAPEYGVILGTRHNLDLRTLF